MEGRRDRPAVAAAYEARLAVHRAEGAVLALRHRRLGNARLAAAGVALTLAVLAFGMGQVSPTWLVAPAVFFVALVVVHSRVLDRQARARRAVEYLEAGLGRLRDQWRGRGATGQAYLTADHPYAEDLDILGPGSLFDLLSTPRTEAGEATLAAWLLGPAVPDVVRTRQAAARDLSGRDLLREDLAVLGPEIRAAANTAALEAWARAPVAPPPVWGPVVLAALSVVTVTGVAMWTSAGEPPDWLASMLALQAAIGLALRRRVRQAIHEVEPRARDLAVVAALVERVERETFDAPQLKAVHARLSATGTPASQEIRRLTRLVELLTSRRNQIFGPLSALLFWATQLSWAVDRWRRKAGAAVPDWLAALGELEALAALGTFTAERPEAVFPEVESGPPRLEARGLAHPLLPAGQAVGNDIAIGGDAPHLMLVSGSNMSGKSTWLRAVGINVVLAHAGAPVTATSLRLTVMTPAGTLRVQDSLQTGRSRFFAEIVKVRQIVDLAKGRAGPAGAGTLFLLDELLAGTNSHDRRLGAEGILRGLLDLGAIGLATTHDLALTDLATALGPRAVNMHFADRFEAGGLEFDFHLRPGVVGTSNALALMRSVGLDV